MTPPKTLATLYRARMFGIQRLEIWLLEHGRKPWAQYADAAFVRYIPHGKRKPDGFVVGGDSAFFIILAGIDTPEPAPGMTPDEPNANGLMCSSSRFSSFAIEYRWEFNAMINPFLEAHPGLLIADYRSTRETSGKAEL